MKSSLLILCLVVVGCSNNNQEIGRFQDSLTNTIVDIPPGFTEDPFIPVPEETDGDPPIVCQDQDSDDATTIAHGLKATLTTCPNCRNLDQFDQDGFVHNVDLYYNLLNIPEVRFSEGFPLIDRITGESLGPVLDPRNGTPLIEWFSLDFTTELRLPPDMEPGEYHLATLSDDGVRLYIDDELYFENPGIHPPTLDCRLKKKIYFDHNTTRKLRLQYFQGPRFHIALSLYWRHISDFRPSNSLYSLGPNHNELDQCGKVHWQSNYNHPDKLGPDHITKARWKYIPAEAFHLPEGETNPCN